jgi:hypothetical protein
MIPGVAGIVKITAGIYRRIACHFKKYKKYIDVINVIQSF